jgi:glycosyltransferase involved in cell wall biosynthesis
MDFSKKVLILVPSTTARGGISNYYQVLRKVLSEDFEYFERGARNWPNRKGLIKELLRAWSDFNKFKTRLSKGDVGLIQTTTSLGLSTTIRDGFFIRYAIKRGIKTIVFFRGWDESAVKKAVRYKCLFKYFFFKADKLITLSKKAKETLLKWGYENEIIVETTLVDKGLLSNVNERSIIHKYESLKKEKNCFKLLYLSRIEDRKGIYDLLEAYEILNQPSSRAIYSYLLNIYGDGSELESVKKLVISKGIVNLNVEGYVEGYQKEKAFREAHLFIFPSHGEGMPNAVLEAMGFGLPVLTTPVGGLVDFFKPGITGSFIKIKDPNDLAENIIQSTLDLDLLMEISLNNFKLANQLFRSDKVAERIRTIFNRTLIN